MRNDQNDALKESQGLHAALLRHLAARSGASPGPAPEAERPRETLARDLAVEIRRIREALAGRSRADVAAWFDRLLADFEQVCPRGFDAEREEYATSQVSPAVGLTTPEAALRLAVVLGCVGDPAALTILRRLALLEGTWVFEEFEDGEYTTRRTEYERTYHALDDCAAIYLHQALHHGETARVLAELGGPLDADARRALLTGGFPATGSTYYGRASCRAELLERYAAALGEIFPRPLSVRRRVAAALGARLVAGGPERTAVLDLALAFFAGEPNLAPADLLAGMIQGQEPFAVQWRAFSVLSAQAAAARAAGGAPVVEPAGLQLRLVESAFAHAEDRGDAVPLGELARCLRESGPTEEVRAFLEARVLDAMPGTATAALAERLVEALGDAVLLGRLARRFVTGGMRVGTARRLAGALGGAAVGERVEFTQALRGAAVGESIADLASTNWADRRKAIEVLVANCERSPEARAALRRQVERERDQVLLNLLHGAEWRFGRAE